MVSDLENDWSIVEDCRKQKFSLVCSAKDYTSFVQFKKACSDIGLNWLILRAAILKFGNHMRISEQNRFAMFLLPGSTLSRLHVSRLTGVNYGMVLQV